MKNGSVDLKNPAVVIWGAGGHASVVADIIAQQGKYRLAGFLDDGQAGHQAENQSGTPILGGRELLPELKARGISYLVFGFGDCAARLQLAELVDRTGLQFARAIHPRSIVAPGASLAPGVVVAAGAVVNPGVRIERNVIVNTNASIDHQTTVGEASHICPGSAIAGSVSIGRGVWIGIGSTVIQGVRIGATSYLGAGSLVLRDIPAGVVAYGSPARVIRKLETPFDMESCTSE